MEKLTKALCKGVLSGDNIIISGKLPKSPDEMPEEKTLYLTGIQAPRCGNPSKLTEEESYAWDSRNFLRKMIAGKVIQYKIDYTQNDRSIGQVIIDNKNCGIELMKNGLCKMYFPKGNEKVTKSDYWTKLESAQDEAKNKKLNIWSGDQTHKRKLYQITDESFDMNQIKEIIKSNTYIDAIIEYVFNCSFYSIYIPHLSVFAKMNLRFVAIPNQKDPNLVKQGKAFVERLALHQDIKLRILGLDDNKNLIGDINCSKGDLAGQILKDGYAKMFSNNNVQSSQEDIRIAQSFMNEAKSNRLRVWKNEPITDNDNKQQKKSSDSDNQLGEVKCCQVHSGDSISVMKNGENIRIFLSNIKAPTLAKVGSLEPDQPWAFQAKEYLRKLLVGRTVRCVFDYEKVSNKEGTLSKEMKFYTVYYYKDDDKEKEKEKCINVQMVENGYASIATYKIEIGENSKELDNMRHADSIAKEKKIGIHGNKHPVLANYSDLISANKNKKKEFISFLTGLKNCNCTVEYCFSGFKLKLRVEKKQCMIPFGLIGVKTFVKDKNNTDLQEKYYLEALNYVNENILQRDGVCDIVAADKVGNYFGHFLYNGKNFGIDLIKKGLAVVNEQNMNPNSYINEFRNAEKEAQSKKVGIWSEEGLANILKFGGVSKSTKKFEEVNQDIKLRVTESEDFHKFYINILPNDDLKAIDKVLDEYNTNPSKRLKLALPIKVGTLCAARFPEDENYYRAIVKRHTKDEKYEVEYIDFGNTELLTQEDLIKLDSKILSYPPQAHFCEMAYLKYSKNSMKKIVKKYPDFVNIDMELNGKICYKYNNGEVDKLGVVIYQKNTDLKSSYHDALLKIGYAKLDRKKTIPECLKELDKSEEIASNGELGLWAENEECDYEEEDDEEDNIY